MSVKKRLLGAFLAVSPFAGWHAHETQDEWVPEVKAFAYDIVESLGIEDTVADMTGMSIDPKLQDYLGAIFLHLESTSNSNVTKQDIIDLVEKMRLHPDEEIVNEFLTDTETVPPDTPKPRNYLKIGHCERYPAPAPDPLPRRLDASMGATVEETVDLVIALRNKDGKVTDEELLTRLEAYASYYNVDVSSMQKVLDGRPAHYWPTDTLLTVPHHILGARLSAEDMAALAAINAEENSPPADGVAEPGVSEAEREGDAEDAAMLQLALVQLRKQIREMESKLTGEHDDILELRLAGLRDEEKELESELSQLDHDPKSGCVIC